MDKIQVKILNPESVEDAERMMVAMGRLTQRGHKIRNMYDFEELLYKPYSKATVDTMTALPHPTIQKFSLINVAIVGASRRFLAQITRHQNEVKFMSASLQYSDYTGASQFVVPYEIMETDNTINCSMREMLKKVHSDDPNFDQARRLYIDTCNAAMDTYERLANCVGNDAAGYAAPQGLRNVLLMSALPYEWKHIISQRTCNRNTKETQYVLLLIWEELKKLGVMFDNCGPDCTTYGCREGKMSCGKPFCKDATPKDILDMSFPLIR